MYGLPSPPSNVFIDSITEQYEIEQQQAVAQQLVSNLNTEQKSALD